MNYTVLQHHDIIGMNFEFRRYQNSDGSISLKNRIQLDKKEILMKGGD